MSDPKKPQRSGWPMPPAPSQPAETKDAGAKRGGRVVHDARGNAVWDWSQSPTDSTTHLLKQLDAPDLSLAEDGPPKDAPAQKKTAADPAAGLDPYNKRNDRNNAQRGAPASPAEPKSKAPKDSVLKQLLGKR